MKKWLIALAGVLTGGVLGLAFVVHRFGRHENPAPSDFVIVLGARVLPNGEPSGALRARTDRAVDLYRKGFAKKLLFTGGVGHYPPAEAVVASRYAIAQGVPAAACILEARSTSTEQNAAFSLPLIGARDSVLVVSDDYHLLRARQVFRRAGREVRLARAARDGRELGALERVYFTCREAFALLFHPLLLTARSPERMHP